MDKEITIRITGEAGQGIQTIGAALCGLFKSCGLHIFANQDYMSRIRGGNNFFQIRVKGSPVLALREKPDIIVALDKQSVALHRPALAAGGNLVLDKKRFDISGSDEALFDVPLYELAASTGGSEIFLNTVSCGVVAAMTGTDFRYLELIIREAFAAKGGEIIGKNIAAAQAGFDFAKNNFKKQEFLLRPGRPVNGALLLNGNEAIGLGAIRGGCKFYSAYPMSPSTGIMDTIAHYSRKYNILVEQAEDEIAAINMIIGASFSGARSMTGTSGGGFALMGEGISLSGMTETPVVVVDAQRPAPATGFPTRTEQADLDLLIHAGHGEFARVVYSPGTIEEAFYLTVKAFNVAEKYQIPVLIMTDQHLADSYRDIESFDMNKAQVERYIISRDASKQVAGYKRYLFAPSGISPRAIPSWIEDPFYADSDEHNEEGHITEDALTRVKMVEKRLYMKMAGLARETEDPVAHNLEKAGSVLIGFGSTYGVIKEACLALGPGFAPLHLPQVWPFPASQVGSLLKGKKSILTVENNAVGQLAGLLKRETGIKADGSILRYDGRPFNLDYLLERIRERGENGN